MKTQQYYRRRALGMTVAAMIVVWILWNIPAFDFIMTPLRLFVTYVHEAGHALAALATGGQVVGFLVSPDGSGLAATAGGNRAFILPAGYLGAALFGSLLFFVANRFPRYARPIAAVLGALMVIFTVLFARPDDRSGLPLALFLGAGFGAALIFIGLRVNAWLAVLLLNVLGVMTALNGVLDLAFLVRYADAGRGMVRNDAAAFSAEIIPILPPAVVAFIWAGLAVLMLAAAIWYGVWKPLRAEIEDSVDAMTLRDGRTR